MRAQRNGVALLAFVIVVFTVFAASPVVQSGDSRLVVYEAESIVTQGDLDLREFGSVIHGWPCYRERERVISRYPFGTALLTVPFLAFTHVAGSAFGVDTTERIRETAPLRLEQLLASAIAALAALALVLLARELTGRLAPALALGLVMALGTSLWSTASRGLWQHGPVVLMTALALTCLVRGRRLRDRRWSALAGLPLGLAFAVRPTIAVTIALVALVLLVSDRRALAGFLATTLAVVLPSFAVTMTLWGTLIVPLYVPGTGPVSSGLSPTLAEGLAGTMVSPARGLLVFSPFLVLALAGLWLRRRRLGGLELVAVGSILALWFGAANTITWEAGASYGSRYLTDTLPFWALLLAPVFALVVRPHRTWSRGVAVLAVLLLAGAAWSGFVHGRGAISWATQQWNSQPKVAYLSNDRERLWDWSDPQFLRTGDARMSDLYPPTGLPAVGPAGLCRFDDQ